MSCPQKEKDSRRGRIANLPPRRAENQFRALDEEEISFLDSIVEDNHDEERERKKAIQDELRAFKECALHLFCLSPLVCFLPGRLTRRARVEP